MMVAGPREVWETALPTGPTHSLDSTAQLQHITRERWQNQTKRPLEDSPRSEDKRQNPEISPQAAGKSKEIVEATYFVNRMSAHNEVLQEECQVASIVAQDAINAKMKGERRINPGRLEPNISIRCTRTQRGVQHEHGGKQATSSKTSRSKATRETWKNKKKETVSTKRPPQRSFDFAAS